METLPGGYCGATEHPRDLLDRQVEVVVQRQGEQVMPGEAFEPCIEVDALGPRSFHSDTVLLHAEVIEPEYLQPPRATSCPALVGDNRKEPRPQLRSGSKPIELAPALERGFLDGVLSCGPVFEHCHGQAERRIEDRLQQLGERGAIARTGALE